jgi:limonene-1,2-epoxide hydrolase
MHDNENLIREFVAAWSQLDPTQLADYFTEDGCYYNMPFQPVRGRKAIEKFITEFAKTWTETTWDIIQMSSSGDIVFCERLDRTKSQLGNVDLPCVGVFEMRDGKIHEWRDYFDANTYSRAMSK